MYTEESIRDIVAAQRKFFRTGDTLPVKWRIKQLKRLKEGVIAHQNEFVQALCEDLGRSELEAYLSDRGYTARTLGTNTFFERDVADNRHQRVNDVTRTY